MLLFTQDTPNQRLSNYLHGILNLSEPSQNIIIYTLSYMPQNIIICLVFAAKLASFRATTQNHNIYMLLDTYGHQTSLFTCFQTPHVIYHHCVTVSRCVTDSLRHSSTQSWQVTSTASQPTAAQTTPQNLIIYITLCLRPHKTYIFTYFCWPKTPQI